MKRVLLITYYWPPSGGSSVQRWLKMLKYFPGMGIEPFVLTVEPQLASYPLRDESLEREIHPDIKVYKTTTREFYNLYKRFTGRKEIPYGGFVNEQKADFKQIISRIIRSHLFIPDPRRGWNRFACKKAVKLIKLHNIETIITATPPHSSQLIGLKLKNKFNVNWIADLQDPWTDIYYYNQLYHSKLSAAIDARYERRVLESADHVVTVSDSIRNVFLSKSSRIDPDKIIVVPNGYDEDDFKEKPETGQEPFVISYTGTINDDYYPLDTFVQTIEKIAAEGRKILLRFVGKVSPLAMQKIKAVKGIRTEFIDYVPHEESIKYLMKTNALLLIIPDIEKNEGILTGKLFEYLGSGKKIIGIGPSGGDAARIIRECESGDMADYLNVNDLENHIRKIMNETDNDRINPNRERIRNYSRRSQAAQIARLI
ncbi:MAG: glycosyltransferase family 4 protein [Bacteroidales bacterium]|nr:glycosyltransferase family 4 protein [Bacteroidales bacterium]